MTAVIHCKGAEAGGADYVYIGRGSKWGNPFVIDRDGRPRDGTREEVIEKYRTYLHSKPELLRDLPELLGKKLGCYCAPLPCHGDVLKELAEGLAECE